MRRGKATFCGPKRNVAEQKGYLSRLLPPGLTVQEAGHFLPEAGATYNVYRVTAFPRGFSGLSTKQGHHPCKTSLSTSLAAQLLVVALFTRLPSLTSDRCY